MKLIEPCANYIANFSKILAAERITYLLAWTAIVREDAMQRFRTLVHFCLDTATALLYTASIAIALACLAFIGTRKPGFAIVIAVMSFIAVAAFHGLRLWRRHSPAFQG
jgi:hypothetical protein